MMSGREDLQHYTSTIWRAVLRALSAYQMYRQHMQVRIRRLDVLKFLFQTRSFPRSLSFCIENMDFNLSRLPKKQAPFRILRQIGKKIEQMPLDQMDNQVLHDFIDELQVMFGELHESIAKTYFPPEIVAAA